MRCRARAWRLYSASCLRQSRPCHWVTHLRHQSSTAAQYAIPEVSPALLARASALSAEHASLNAQLATSFSTRLARQLGPLSRASSALNSYTSAHTALSELHALLSDPETDPSLLPLAQEDLPVLHSTLLNAVSELKSSLVPDHPFAHLPCLIEIRPGAGGSEAALFAADLVRMYTSYLSRRSTPYTMLKYESSAGTSDPSSSDAPLLEAVLEVDSPGSYGHMRCEAGVHRVQRVPATESKGRTHTSSASVLVLPSFPDTSGSEDPDDELASVLDEKDVRVDIMRAKGAGGQHVNTTNSAVRLTHVPTGTVVAIQDQRSQHRNKDKAWRLLRARVAQMVREEKEAEMLKLRRGVVAANKVGRENKIRTYNWGQQRVTDHRSGFSVQGALDGVLQGGEALDTVMESVRRWMEDEEVGALTAAGSSEVDAVKK